MSDKALYLISYPSKIHLYCRHFETDDQWSFFESDFDIKHPIDLQISKALDALPDDFATNCREVKIVHQNQINTWVPKDFYNEECLEDYLKYNAKSFKVDYLAADEIEPLDLFNIYGFHPQFHQYLETRFSNGSSVHHFDSLLLKSIFKLHLQKPYQLYAYIGHKHLFITAFSQKNTPTFINHFSIETKEDALYYLLFTLEQLKVVAHQSSILLLGELHWQSFLENYIQNVANLDASENNRFIQSILLES